MPQAKKVQKLNDTFIAKSDKFNISIPSTPTGNIILEKPIAKAFKKASKSKKAAYKLIISLPNKESNTFLGNAKVAKENSVVYKDYQENTDVVVQALKGSIRILTILNDADAPTEYAYDINVPIGGHMEKSKDGSIIILDENEKFIGGFAEAWAIDKDGKKIPTHYEIRGNTLVQIVEHLSTNVSYPIVADPYGGTNMIYGAKWTYKRQPKGNPWYHYKLTVWPTSWGRGLNGKKHANQGWNELRTFSFLNYNTRSMEYQYRCHVYFGWLQNRSEYHLEHWRPATSWWRTLAYRCNPPGYVN